jgi:hypothetical protein
LPVEAEYGLESTGFPNYLFHQVLRRVPVGMMDANRSGGPKGCAAPLDQLSRRRFLWHAQWHQPKACGRGAD